MVIYYLTAMCMYIYTHTHNTHIYITYKPFYYSLITFRLILISFTILFSLKLEIISLIKALIICKHKWKFLMITRTFLFLTTTNAH